MFSWTQDLLGHTLSQHRSNLDILHWGAGDTQLGNNTQEVADNAIAAADRMKTEVRRTPSSASSSEVAKCNSNPTRGWYAGHVFVRERVNLFILETTRWLDF